MQTNAMQIVGAFVKLSHWLPLMLDAVAAPHASLTTRVNALVVLSAMLYASGNLKCRAVQNSPSVRHAACNEQQAPQRCKAGSCPSE